MFGKMFRLIRVVKRCLPTTIAASRGFARAHTQKSNPTKLFSRAPIASSKLAQPGSGDSVASPPDPTTPPGTEAQERQDVQTTPQIAGGEMLPQSTTASGSNETKEEEPIGTYTYPEHLVIRPPKGYLWGLGAEIRTQVRSKDKQDCVDYFKPTDEEPSVEQIVELLKDFQITNIKHFEMPNYQEVALGRWCVVGSGESTRHIYRVAKILTSELRKLKGEGAKYTQLLGGKRDSWLLVLTREIEVHIVLAEDRESLDLENTLAYHTPTPESDDEDDRDFDTDASSKKRKAKISKKRARLLASETRDP